MASAPWVSEVVMGRLCCVGLFVVSWASGCVPSREAKSAGEIGCSPDEISISNEESHFGFVQSGETWVAECQGHSFVCSQVNQSGKNEGLFSSLFASEQVSCHEAPESREAERNRRAREMAATERANRPPPKPPTGAAGFDFGLTPEDVAQRCEAAGLEWRGGSEKNGCSGPASSLGIAANVDVDFCDGRACAITVQHVPHGDLSRSSVSLKANLELKYGPPQESSGPLPENCRSEPAFTHCVESQQVTLRYGWRWAGGESIEMSVGKPNDAANPAIRLVYRRPRGAANISAL